MKVFDRFRKREKEEKQAQKRMKQANTERKEYLFKITLLGDGAVGKTSLRKRYMGQGFTTQHLMTIGADFAILEKEIEGHKLTWQIWDLAGQESFKKVRSMYYKGCFGALLVFDMTRRTSFENLDIWLKELYKHSGRGKVPVIVLANKADLADQREVSPEEAEEYVAKLQKSVAKEGIEVKYLETSALTGLNVEKAFNMLGDAIMKHLRARRR